jgi:FAD:protein FMN transferase
MPIFTSAGRLSSRSLAYWVFAVALAAAPASAAFAMPRNPAHTHLRPMEPPAVRPMCRARGEAARLGPALLQHSLAFALHAGESLSRFEYTEYHMGVDVRIVVYAPDKPHAEAACTAAFERIAELDTTMSDYRVDSELNRLCARAGGPPVTVSKDLFLVLQRSQELARRSGGAFDVTCGPLVRLWRAARKSGVPPTRVQVAIARARMGWRLVELDPRARSVRLLKKGMQLDLGGIGKGYAGDRAQAALKRRGVTRALVQAGGDIVVTDPPPGEAGWKIEVPNAEAAGAPPLTYANAAVSTSGDLEQSVEIAGRRYSHIMDPRSGRPLTDRIQVTIVARDGLTSDGLSTAVSVLGPARGRKLAASYPAVKSYIKFGAGPPDAPDGGKRLPLP